MPYSKRTHSGIRAYEQYCQLTQIIHQLLRKYRSHPALCAHAQQFRQSASNRFDPRSEIIHDYKVFSHNNGICNTYADRTIRCNTYMLFFGNILFFNVELA